MTSQRVFRPVAICLLVLAAAIAFEPALTASRVDQGARGVVENVTYENANGVFTIFYDLKSDTAGAMFNIAVTATATEAGVPRQVVAKTVTGDVRNVRPGPPRKRIVWQSGSDVPAFSFDSLRFELQATPVGGAAPQGAGASDVGNNKFLKLWLPIIGGGAAAGLFAFMAMSKEPCSFSVNPASVTIPPTGGQTTVSVGTSPADCSPNSWSFSNLGFVTASPASGSGAATVTLSASQNTGAPQTQAVSVAGQTVMVSQAGGCTLFQASPNPLTVPRTQGLSGPITITATPPDCGPTNWTAAFGTNPSTFMTGLTPSTGTSGQSFQFTAQTNSGGVRTGVVRITPGQGAAFDVAVTQAANDTCTYNLARNPGANIPATQTNITVSITTQTGCSWRVRFQPNPNTFLRFLNMTQDNGVTATGTSTNTNLMVQAAANAGGWREGIILLTDVVTNEQRGNLIITQVGAALLPDVMPISLRR